jgi:hypothetical protein
MVEPANRERLHSALRGPVGFGVVVSYWFEYDLSYVDGSAAWRVPIAFQMVVAVDSLSLLDFLRECLRWLIAHDRLDEATAVLAAVESKDATEDHPNVVACRNNIIHALELEYAQGPVLWGELFENNETKDRSLFFLAIGIQIFQRMSGENVLLYYIPYLLRTSMKLDERTSLSISGLIGIVRFLSSAYPVIFIDRFGRPKPFMVALTVQALSMAMAAIILSLNGTSANHAVIGMFDGPFSSNPRDKDNPSKSSPSPTSPSSEHATWGHHGSTHPSFSFSGFTPKAQPSQQASLGSAPFL